MEKKNDEGLATYCWLHARIVLVSVASLWLYFSHVDLLARPILDALGMAESIETVVAELPSFYYGVTIITVLKFVIGMLFWWRAVKVAVLLGSPFKFGVTMAGGRENGGKTGRPVTLAHIGDKDVYRDGYAGKFWFGLIARSHPASDKIVRSRIEFLIAALPFGGSLLIRESRFMLLKHDHAARGEAFRSVGDYYGNTREKMPVDQFQGDLVAAMKPISAFYAHAKDVRRIDGLNWQEFWGGSGRIWDDFGYEISFERLEEEERYKVVDGSGVTTVGSVEELRRFAKERLHPVSASQGGGDSQTQ